MNFNPFKEKGTKVCQSFRNWEQMNPQAYDKVKTNPYTKTRVILANGTEFEGGNTQRLASMCVPNNFSPSWEMA